MDPIYPDLNGKVVLITGAARGIGKALALEFARQKSRLIIDDLPEKREQLETVKNEILSMGADVAVVIADVRKENEVESSSRIPWLCMSELTFS